jgi:hypothetical protein
MNAETEGIADQELNMQFKTLNLHDAAFSIGFTQALYNGKFTWADRSTPSNFSPFCIFEVEPLLAAEQQNRHFVLHIIQTQGKGRTIEEIKSSNKQEVKAPISYLEMVQQLRYYAGACQIFFGEFSVATTSINALLSIIDKYKHIFKARESSETEFVSKFLFAVDQRMQLWLEECATLTSRDQVDDSTLNFSSMVDSVRFGSFDIKLPPTFCKVDNENDKKRPSKAGNDKADGENKSTKKPKKAAALINSSPPRRMQTQRRRNLGNKLCQQSRRTSFLGGHSPNVPTLVHHWSLFLQLQQRQEPRRSSRHSRRQTHRLQGIHAQMPRKHLKGRAGA